jgi:hypothetical protein
MRDSLLCFMHNPNAALKAQDARRKGGQRAHSPPSAVDLGIDLGSPEMNVSCHGYTSRTGTGRDEGPRGGTERPTQTRTTYLTMSRVVRTIKIGRVWRYHRRPSPYFPSLSPSSC